MQKIWIITAMAEEADHLITLFGLQATKSLQNISFFENDEVVLALSGVGKIQASIATSLLCMEYELKCLINIGIAWSLLGQEAKIGDVFLINTVAQHDMYLPFDGEHLNYAKSPIFFTFSSYQSRKKRRLNPSWRFLSDGRSVYWWYWKSKRTKGTNWRSCSRNGSICCSKRCSWVLNTRKTDNHQSNFRWSW